MSETLFRQVVSEYQGTNIKGRQVRWINRRRGNMKVAHYQSSVVVSIISVIVIIIIRHHIISHHHHSIHHHQSTVVVSIISVNISR